MWTIGEVKRAGWAKVKHYYWPALVVTIIAGLFAGGGGSGSSSAVGNTSNSSDEISYYSDFNIPDIESLDIESPNIRTPDRLPQNPVSAIVGNMIASIAIGVFLLVFLVLMLLKIFVGNVLIVGKNRFFMESRSLEASAGIGKVGWVFSSGHYLNVVKIMFLRDLYTILWTLLLVIPGIIKSYEYTMIPYILSENPEADTKDVFALTKDMMAGSKFHYFLLQLSFIGWYLLGFCACCIGMIFVCPFEEATYAEVYASMRREIGGFPFNGYGMEEAGNVYERVMNSNARYGDGTGSDDDFNRY